MNQRTFAGAIALTVLSLIAVIYWPVLHAGLVWDDKIIFHDNAWLRYGDGWKHLVFRSFFDWTEYFRPVVVALFVFEARVLDAASGPMHLTSLAIHLANTLLIGLLARNLLQANSGAVKSAIFSGITMLLYGLHPALIEPVTWISSQAELVVTFFILFGLLFNAVLLNPALRAACVGTCFFLAACSKESAVSFPLLLLVWDWMYPRTDETGLAPGARLWAIWRRQRPVYLFVLAAGIAYLVLRHWALGVLVNPAAHEPFFSFARLQTVSFIYLTYWQILVWPMTGLGPLHEIDAQQFAVFTGASFVTDLTALTILLGGLHMAWKRKRLGCLIVAVSVALLPVLHILPVRFDASLYHERYAMTALAMMCAILPVAVADVRWPRSSVSGLTVIASLPIAVWLALALINIHVTLPLWSDETKLWLWVLREHPDSVSAKDHLLSTYIEVNDYLHARQLADSLVAENAPCPNCMINAANLALAQGDVMRASTALEKAKDMPALQNQPQQVQSFILATGQLRELQGDPHGAEEAYRDAITMEPLNPQAQMNLALLLARQSRVPEARQAADRALSLFAPDERNQRRQVFEQTLATATAAPQVPATSLHQ